ncbi:hypothetical protein TELCIR_12527, partial [Teladorsagia circumcincta]
SSAECVLWIALPSYFIASWERHLAPAGDGICQSLQYNPYVIQEGRFKCVCPKGFKGDYCETNIDDCEKIKCQNGAKCVDMGKKCSLSIDNLAGQSIENDGKLEIFALETKQYLYIGGLPPDRAARVKESFHVKESNSFTGCISDVFVNEVAVDFENAVEKERITVGCTHVVDLCAGVVDSAIRLCTALWLPLMWEGRVPPEPGRRDQTDSGARQARDLNYHNEHVEAVTETALVQLNVEEQRLRWYGHVLRRLQGKNWQWTLKRKSTGRKQPQRRGEETSSRRASLKSGPWQKMFWIEQHGDDCKCSGLRGTKARDKKEL